MGKIKRKGVNLTLEMVETALAIDQPKLTVQQKEGFFCIEGKFIVLGREKVHPNGPITEFEVEIFATAKFPREEPRVFEVGGRIPKDIDRHVYPSSGRCCVTVWEAWVIKEEKPSFSDFLNGPVNQFFLSQYLFEKTEKWHLGEFSHGVEGLYEAFSDVLKVKKEPEVITNHLTVLSQAWPKGHNLCPCGSGSTIRNCCQEKLMALHHKIPPAQARKMLRDIKELKDLR